MQHTAIHSISAPGRSNCSPHVHKELKRHPTSARLKFTEIVKTNGNNSSKPAEFLKSCEELNKRNLESKSEIALPVVSSYLQNFNGWREKDFIVAMLATVGLVLQTIQREYTWDDSTAKLGISDIPDANQHPRN